MNRLVWVVSMSSSGVGGSRVGRVRLRELASSVGGKISAPVIFGLAMMAWWSPGTLLTSDAQSAPIRR